MFQVPLKQFIDESHELVQLSGKIDWKSLENGLSVYYCADNGRPGVPIRLIVGVIMLRRMYNQSDESVLNRWVENPYWQYFCGEIYFRYDFPFDRTELMKFRRRIGEKGAERILKATVDLFGNKEIRKKEVLTDTTVQEKNITFPTDVKLQKKIYSIHQPQVSCIAKGKEHRKYEFGNKVSITKTRKSGIIIGIMSFCGNPFDGDTLAPQLAQVERITGHKPETGIVDRGYRGRKQVNGTQIICPGKPLKNSNKYQRQKTRQRFRARAGIEPVIGHVKHDHRMLKNYLLDQVGDNMNSILAAVGFNLRKMLRRLKSGVKNIFELFENLIFLFNRNLSFMLFEKMRVFHV